MAQAWQRDESSCIGLGEAGAFDETPVADPEALIEMLHHQFGDLFHGEKICCVLVRHH